MPSALTLPQVEDSRGSTGIGFPRTVAGRREPPPAHRRAARSPYRDRVYLRSVMRGFCNILDELGPTAVDASAFPYLHIHQLAACDERRRVPVLLHGAVHPEIVLLGGRLRRQHRLRGRVHRGLSSISRGITLEYETAARRSVRGRFAS